jgi:hypothetical protein
MLTARKVPLRRTRHTDRRRHRFFARTRFTHMYGYQLFAPTPRHCHPESAVQGEGPRYFVLPRLAAMRRDARTRNRAQTRPFPTYNEKGPSSWTAGLRMTVCEVSAVNMPRCSPHGKRCFGALGTRPGAVTGFLHAPVSRTCTVINYLRTPHGTVILSPLFRAKDPGISSYPSSPPCGETRAAQPGADAPGSRG